MTPPLLTITIPTWNRCAYLDETMESISSQAVALGVADRIEILIADNCSDDNTPGIVKKYTDAGNVPVRCHRQARNLGPVSNILYCLTHSDGTFLMLLGDDDLLAPGGLEAIWKTLESHGEATVFVFNNLQCPRAITLPAPAAVTIAEAARLAFYHMGNAGVFVVRSGFARRAVEQCGPAHPWTCWLQTEVMLRAAALSGLQRPFVLAPHISSTSPHHGPNTRYTAYYYWESAMVSLAKTALNARMETAPELFKSAIGHLSGFRSVAMKIWILAKLLATSDTEAERRAYQKMTAEARALRIPGLRGWFWIADRIGRVPLFLLRGFVHCVIFVRHHTKPGHTYKKASGAGGRAYTEESFKTGGD